MLNTRPRSALVITQKTRRIDCLEVFFTVMQTIIQGRRLRVSVDEGLEWISELTIWTYDQHKTASTFIRGYASPSLLVAATSSIPLSSIILVEHHYKQLLLLLTTTTNNDQQQQPTTTTIALSIIVYNNFMMMDHGRLLRITNAEGS